MANAIWQRLLSPGSSSETINSIVANIERFAKESYGIDIHPEMVSLNLETGTADVPFDITTPVPGIKKTTNFIAAIPMGRTLDIGSISMRFESAKNAIIESEERMRRMKESAEVLETAETADDAWAVAEKAMRGRWAGRSNIDKRLARIKGKADAFIEQTVRFF